MNAFNKSFYSNFSLQKFSPKKNLIKEKSFNCFLVQWFPTWEVYLSREVESDFSGGEQKLCIRIIAFLPKPKL